MWPSVTITQQNNFSGESTEIERHLLFIGEGAKDTGKLLAVNAQTDLNKLFDDECNAFKAHLVAAQLNAGQNFYAHAYSLADDEDWADAVRAAQTVSSFEGVVLCVDVDNQAEIEKAAALRQELLGKLGRFTWFLLSVRGITQPDEDATPAVEGESWPDYVEELAKLQDGIAAGSVQLVPRLYGADAGALAGRLCSTTVTIADSPARVKTGALVGLGEKPCDKSGSTLDLATLRTLEENRFSVPMWYADFDGTYWTDGRTLDAEGGDFQSIQALRVADKVARRVQKKAIARIGDRSLNSSPSSMAENTQFFMQTMREMALSVQIGGVTFPGECLTPQDGDVVIQWESKKKVSIYLVVRTTDCPMGISITVALDNTLAGGEK